MTSRNSSRIVGVAAAFALVVAGAGGCTLPWSNGGGADPSTGASDPRRAAEAFATAVAKGDLTGVPIAQGVAATATSGLSAALAGMGSIHPQVDVVDVPEVHGDTQQTTVTLHYSWPIRAGVPAWEYDAKLNVVREAGPDGQVWRAGWAVAALSPDLHRGERLQLISVPGKRGDILAADGTPIVTLRPVQRVGIDRTKLTPEQIGPSAAAVAAAVGVNAGTYTAAVRGAGASAFVEAITLRESDPMLAAARTKLDTIPGAVLLPTMLPLASTRTFARPLLGTVGQATAEMVSASGGSVKAGDLVGIGGLQQAQEATLKGSSGVQVRAVGTVSGTPVSRILHSVDAVPGTTLTTTLDLRLQSKAEALLVKVKPASAIVAVRPSTGAVLAAASGPGGQGYSTATLGQYAPGSTFKVASSLALLRRGLTPDTAVRCTPTAVVDGRAFTNHDGYPASATGSIPLRAAFAHSCNTAFVQAAGSLPQADLVSAAASLGLAGDPALGVPAYLGAVPESADAVQHAASMIGQDRVLASPLGMAVVAASAGAGHAVVPRLLDARSSAPAASLATTPSADRKSVV